MEAEARVVARPTPRERALDAELAELRVALEVRDEAIAGLRGDVADAEAARSAAEDEASDLQSEIDELRADLERIDDHISTLVRVRDLIKAGRFDDAMRDVETVLHHLDGAWSCRGAGLL